MNTKKKRIIIAILGPTASGKSEAAVMLSEMIDGEIISCDSMQIYKGMEIVTQSPSADFLSRVPHHLIGIIPPEEEFNAAKFTELSRTAVEDICLRGKVPVFSGGTGLYAKALLEGIFPSPPKDEKLRESLEREALEKGNLRLYERLKRVDPLAASNIDPQNLRRVIRALEVFELSGKTFSEKKTETKGIGDEFDAKLFALDVPRDILVERINLRVEAMFAAGLVEEAKRLISRKISQTASKALGINETARFISGEINLEECKNQLKIKTRQYAKRQMTWLRSVKNLEWVKAAAGSRVTASEIAVRAGFKSV